MHIEVVTLFPERVIPVGEYGVTGRAATKGLLSVGCWNPRDYTHDRHRTVDDRPYGGGPGMVMDAKAAAGPAAPVVYLSPQGRRLDQDKARELAKLPGLVLVTGRYEGIDERFVDVHVDEELSLGDYVLSGGELAAMVVIDVVARLLPGVLGDAESAEQDSFMDGLLDYPHYTRPEAVDGRAVPEVLLTGNHAEVRRWRHKQALGRTWQRRPDLLAGCELNEEDQRLLEEFIEESAAKADD
jgi:tRNA (guanine37-N1)-methyltransferase